MSVGVIIVENVALTDFSGSICNLVASGNISIKNISVTNSKTTASPLIAVSQAREVDFDQILVHYMILSQGLIAIQGITGNLQISNLELKATSDLGPATNHPYLIVTDTQNF